MPKPISVSPKTREFLIQRSGNLCEICRRASDWRGLQPAHIKHRKMGGSRKKEIVDDPTNIMFLCSDCHDKLDGRQPMDKAFWDRFIEVSERIGFKW